MLLSGGVGGARMARGFAAILDPDDLTVVVNVGDDATIYGVHVSADVDTVVYTLAGIEGKDGWGRRNDTFEVMEALSRFGVDTRFRLGDKDLALCMVRTDRLAKGNTLTQITHDLAGRLGVGPLVLPATDAQVRTSLRIDDTTWLDFQDYFVIRGHEDRVLEVTYEGAAKARPAPGVIEAIRAAELIVIAPSNPPLSIWPILAIPGIGDELRRKRIVAAVSPLIGGRALRGPAAEVMRSLDLPAGNSGVAAAYDGLLSHLVVDSSDSADVADLRTGGVVPVVDDIRISDLEAAAALAARVLSLVSRPDSG